MATNKYQKKTKSSRTPLSNDLLKSANLSHLEGKLKVDPLNDLAKLSMGARLTSKAIDFGSPSERGTKTPSTQQSSAWSGLLKTAASGGVSDLLGGGGILNAGLDYLTSGLTKLFGAGDKKTVTPLVRFELPDAQDRTVYTAGSVAQYNTSAANSTSTVFSSAAAATVNPGTTSYGSIQISSPSTSVQKAQIVQTIKNALLTSSSLNDIIGEL